MRRAVFGYAAVAALLAACAGSTAPNPPRLNLTGTWTGEIVSSDMVCTRYQLNLEESWPPGGAFIDGTWLLSGCHGGSVIPGDLGGPVTGDNVHLQLSDDTTFTGRVNSQDDTIVGKLNNNIPLTLTRN